MIQAEDYRAKAEDCARRASEAQDEYHRKNFRELATMWFEMAEKAERRSGVSVPETDSTEVEDALATIRDAEKRA